MQDQLIGIVRTLENLPEISTLINLLAAYIKKLFEPLWQLPGHCTTGDLRNGTRQAAKRRTWLMSSLTSKGLAR